MGFPTQPDSSSQDVAASESSTLRDQRSKSTFTDEVGDIGHTGHTGDTGAGTALKRFFYASVENCHFFLRVIMIHVRVCPIVFRVLPLMCDAFNESIMIKHGTWRFQ